MMYVVDAADWKLVEWRRRVVVSLEITAERRGAIVLQADE